MHLKPEDVLRQLVAIPSVNPMGGQPEGSEFAERKLTDFLENLFRDIGLGYVRQPVEAGRDNLVAVLHGPRGDGGALLLFDIHQDTVPATGMVISPFRPEIRNGRLYGRGACDVKGGMASILSAVSRLATDRPASMPSIAIACTVNEEFGFSGVKALHRLWKPGGFLPCRPDAAVVAEPTELQVVVAHKGVVRWTCHTTGLAAHSATPERGDSAIYKMARALGAIERYQKEVLVRQTAHRLCGPSTLNVGTIHGGVSVNTVPDRCTIEIERRLTPEEKPESARQHLIDFLAHAGLESAIQHDPPSMIAEPLRENSSRELADRLERAVRGQVGECRQMGVPYATDAATLAAEGVPAVVFGPGSIAQAHTADEWIDLEQLRQASEIIYRFVGTWGG